MRRPILMLAALFAGIAATSDVRAETLVTAISADTVSIESNFTGARIVVFGTIERDANTVSRRQGHDIVIAVRGPQDTLTVRQKERVAGIWVNTDARSYDDVPRFLAVLSNRPLAEIADASVIAKNKLSLHGLGDGRTAGPVETAQSEMVDAPSRFRRAAVRLMQDRALYQEDAGAVRFLSPTLFMAQVDLPATTPVGTYRAEVYLFGDGALLDVQSVRIYVQKSGVEQLITELASDHPLLYGIITVLIAMVSGWFASVMFRRD